MSKGFNVKILEHKSLNLGETVCNNQRKENIRDCIERYIAQTLNCTLPWAKMRIQNQEICNSQSKVKALEDEITKMSQSELSMSLNCTFPCTVPEFVTDPVYEFEFPRNDDCSNGPLTTRNSTLRSCNDLLRISFVVPDRKLYKIEEVLLYDDDNLIADVGGYLGLLLGANILTFYDVIVQLAKKYQGIFNKST